MASAADVLELQTKLKALVAERFGGNWASAFKAYDANGDGRIDANELETLLADANVGNFVTRSSWVRGVLDEVDTNRDGTISYDELQRAIAAPAPIDAANPQAQQGTPRPDYLFPVDYPPNFTPAHPNPQVPPKPPPKNDASGLVAVFVLGGLFAGGWLLLRRRR